jgi:hypothetical protein
MVSQRFLVLFPILQQSAFCPTIALFAIEAIADPL